MTDEEARAEQPAVPTEGEPEAEAQPVSAESPEVEAMQRDLEEARAKEQEFRNLLQRVQADFVNYKRRVEQERAEQALSDKAAIFRTILPIVDDFERAIEATPPDLAEHDWVKGVQLVLRKLHVTLEQQGVKPMEPLGKDFDPWEHEAVLSEESGPENTGKVVAVLREGYKLDGRVIRPAQVKVGA